MKKVFVNGASLVRTLSPFAYKDPIKTLDKSNEARVELDGVTVFRSCVTSGRDVKNAAGGLKYHLYFYATKAAADSRDTAKRDFMPITAEEFRAYKDDPAYRMVLVTADPVATVSETEVVVAETPETEVLPTADAPETEVLVAPEAGNESTTKRAKRK